MASNAAPLSAEKFQNLLNVSRENMERLSIYAEHLKRWNTRINLVSTASMTDLWRRHILDSAQLIDHLPPQVVEIADLGTGAGFPGLVLAILSNHRTHLIEANTRKAAFLVEVARLTEASASVHIGRIEDLEPFPVDVITARALAPLPRLLKIARPILEISANRAPICLFLKGTKWREELTTAQKEWKIRASSFASISDPIGRVIVVGNVSRKESAP